MKSLSRPLSTSPRTMWVLFAIVLAAIVAGFAWLSRHALELNRQQQTAAHRESLDQNIRIALWRLDSKLGPYLASVHDPNANRKFQKAMGIENDFVLSRFKVYPDSSDTKSDSTKSPAVIEIVDAEPKTKVQMGSELIADPAQREAKLRERIPMDQLLVAVRDRLPEYAGWNNEFDQRQQVPFQNQALVPPYNVNSLNVADQRAGIVERRGAVQQSQTMAYLGNNAFESPTLTDAISISPFWIRNELLLVKARLGLMQSFDGVWLDWKGLEQSLREDIADLVPDAEFQPILQDEPPNPTRTLAALPVEIATSDSPNVNVNWSATHTTLLLSWLGLALAACITAMAMHRLISLSEHRASFVSAVTHELRTPLTTFRLYSDMLERGMVKDPVDQKEYLQTLRREADRLTHLVDNVLRYSRLERNRSGPSMEIVHLKEWCGRITPRLDQRLAEASMELVVDCQSDGQWQTDPAAMEQVVFNLIDNAAKYAQDATDRRVILQAKIDDNHVAISVKDHGAGVPKELRAMIFKPFTKSAERAAETAAGVGLGLALAKKTAMTLGGNLCYEDAEGGGACFKLTFPTRQ